MRRRLDPELKVYLKALISPEVGPPVAAFARGTSSNLLVLLTGQLLQHVGEQGGENRGRLVELMQKTIGVAQAEPWCIAYLQSCVAFVEDYTGVRSWIHATESALELWEQSTWSRVIDPRPGDLILWEKEGTRAGHGGIIAEVLRSSPRGSIVGFKTIEGNTGAGRGTIEREGDGVYPRTRPLGGVGRMRELGYLRPFGEAPAQPGAAVTH